MSDLESQPNPYAPSSVLDESNQSIDFFGSPQEMGKVAMGLNLVYWGIALILLAIVGTPVLMIMVGGGIGNGGGIETMSAVAIIIGCLFMGGVIIGIVGRIMCLSVPESSGARPMIIAAVCCDAIVVLLTIASFFSSAAEIASGMNNLLSLLATLFFVLFMRRVSLAIVRGDLAERASGLIKMGGILFLLAIGTGVGAFFIGMVAAVLGLAVLVMGLVMFFRYVRLIVDLRKAILGTG